MVSRGGRAALGDPIRRPYLGEWTLGLGDPQLAQSVACLLCRNGEVGFVVECGALSNKFVMSCSMLDKSRAGHCAAVTMFLLPYS